MGSKYQPVDAGDDEKFHEVFPRRSSTSTSDSTLLEDDTEDSRMLQPKKTSRWMWIVHALLLSLSFSMFVSSFFTRASTLQHVKQFSAYCKLPVLQITTVVLTALKRLLQRQ